MLNLKFLLCMIVTVNEIDMTQVSYTVSFKANFGNRTSATSSEIPGLAFYIHGALVASLP